MVYKRYIKKGGKLYGPYIYHSHKKDGKVISKYLGRHEEHKLHTKHKNFFSKKVFIFTLLSLVLISGILLMNLVLIPIFFGPEEKFILSIDNTYLSGQDLTGSVKINLKRGELIPLSTNILIDNIGEQNEFLLSDFISSEVTSGNFYLENIEISGEGEGYGVMGERIVYPEVSFILRITKGLGKVPSDVGGGGPPSGEEEEEPIDEFDIIPEENDTEEPLPEENDTGSVESPGDIPEEEIPSEEPGIQIPFPLPTPEETPEEEIPSEESTPEKESESESTPESGSSSEPESTSESSSESSESETQESPPETIIEDVITKETFYIYELLPGETAEILSSSQDVDLVIEDGIVTITTDYSEIEEGFGQDYLIENIVSLEIDLTNLNLPAKQGDFVVSLVYDSVEIFSLSEEITVFEEIIDEIEENETIVPANITEMNITKGNETNVTTDIQFDAVIGQPVQWKKIVRPDKPGELKVKIPKSAKNVRVKVTEDENGNKVDEDLTEEDFIIEVAGETIQEILEVNETNGTIIVNETKETNETIITNSTNKTIGIIGGVITESFSTNTQTTFKEVILDGQSNEYEIEYETPAPYIGSEVENPNGKTVIVVGPDDIHYENVLAFTDLSEKLNLKNPSRVKIQWVEQNTFIPVLSIQDKDLNGIYDYIEWIVPKTSNQTFNIIIITKAEHLDSNLSLINDITDEVIELDNVWSKTIPSGDYVRVTFEIPLTSSNDITVYPRIVSGNPKIEVYEIGQSILIAEFINLSGNEYNKVFLTNLTSASQDVFDLKILNGEIEFDHIIDPLAQPGGTVDLRAQACNQENEQATQGTFGEACDTIYPGDCGSGVNAVSCDDGIFEEFNSNGAWGGINVTYFNSTITDCGSVGDVFLCYEWWANGNTAASDISVDADGGISYTATTASEPASDNIPPGVSCINVTELESWTCSNFFGSEGTRAFAKMNADKQGGGLRIYKVDVLLFNVTYDVAGELNVSLVTPTDGQSVTQNDTFSVNATVTCETNDCGTVTGIVRYNASSIVPDTSISITEGGLPFYVSYPITAVDYTNQTDGFSTVPEMSTNPPSGITSNGASLWVFDPAATPNPKMYHYGLDGVYASSGDVTLNILNSNLQGIVNDGSDFWIVSEGDDFVYHFNSAGQNQTGGFKIGAAGAGSPKGITTNGSDFWILDQFDDFVYHFDASRINVTLSTGGGNPGFDIELAGASFAYGITTNGSDFWVTDDTDDYLYHFDDQGNNVTTDGFDLEGITSTRGITTKLVFPGDLPGISPLNFWIAGGFSDKFVTHYERTSGNPQSCGNLNLGDYCELNWTINKTGTGTEIDVLFVSDSSSVADNDTLDSTILAGVAESSGCTLPGTLSIIEDSTQTIHIELSDCFVAGFWKPNDEDYLNLTPRGEMFNLSVWNGSEYTKSHVFGKNDSDRSTGFLEHYDWWASNLNSVSGWRVFPWNRGVDINYGLVLDTPQMKIIRFNGTEEDGNMKWETLWIMRNDWNFVRAYHKKTYVEGSYGTQDQIAWFWDSEVFNVSQGDRVFITNETGGKFEENLTDNGKIAYWNLFASVDSGSMNRFPFLSHYDNDTDTSSGIVALYTESPLMSKTVDWSFDTHDIIGVFKGYDIATEPQLHWMGVSGSIRNPGEEAIFDNFVFVGKGLDTDSETASEWFSLFSINRTVSSEVRAGERLVDSVNTAGMWSIYTKLFNCPGECGEGTLTKNWAIYPLSYLSKEGVDDARPENSETLWIFETKVKAIEESGIVIEKTNLDSSDAEIYNSESISWVNDQFSVGGLYPFDGNINYSIYNDSDKMIIFANVTTGSSSQIKEIFVELDYTENFDVNYYKNVNVVKLNDTTYDIRWMDAVLGEVGTMVYGVENVVNITDTGSELRIYLLNGTIVQNNKNFNITFAIWNHEGYKTISDMIGLHERASVNYTQHYIKINSSDDRYAILEFGESAVINSTYVLDDNLTLYFWGLEGTKQNYDVYYDGIGVQDVLVDKVSSSGWSYNNVSKRVKFTIDYRDDSLKEVIITNISGSGINGPPLHDPPIILPDPAVETRDITCVNVSTEDPNGDNVTNIYNWKLDGVPITLLNMPFDTNVSSIASNAVRDYSGNNNNGTLGSGANQPLWVPDCKVGGCYNFSINDRITISDDSVFDSQEFTIIAWINKSLSSSGTETIVKKDGQFILRLHSDNKLWGYMWATSATAISSTGALGDDTWYHVAYVVNKTQHALYIDGVLNNTALNSNVRGYSVNPVTIGSSPSATEDFNGRIDEFKMFNRSFSSEQIYQLYLEGNNSITNSTIVTQEINLNEVWTCEVTPTDSDLEGVTKSDSATITLASCQPPLTLDWNVTEDCRITNSVINMNADQNLNILSGGNLTLENVTINMNPTLNGRANITVFSGGFMNITDFNGNGSLINSTNLNNHYGFVVNSGSNFSMTNSQVEEAGWAGGLGMSGLEINITITDFSGNTLKNNHYGIRLLTENSIIKNNRFIGNDIGVFLENSSNTNIINNSFEGGIGIITSTLVFLNTNISIINNSFINHTSYGIGLFTTSYSEIIGNTITGGSSGSGISVLGGSFGDTKSNNISYNTISNNTGNGIGIFGSGFGGINESVFLGNVIENNDYGIYLATDGPFENSNNLYINNVIKNSSVFDYRSDGNNTFINTTFNKSSVQIDNGSLTVQWYLDVNVTDDISNNSLSSANVSGYNRTNAIIFSELTDTTGFIARQNVTEYIQNTTSKNYWTNYTINITRSKYLEGTVEINITNSFLLSVSLTKLPSPIVNLISPENNVFFNTNNVSFVCNANDSNGLANLSLLSNFNFTEYDYDENMIIWYHLDNNASLGESSGNKIVDFSGYSNNITDGDFGFNGFPPPSATANSLIKGGYKFSGGFGFLKIPFNNVTNISQYEELTVSVWANISNLSSNAKLIGTSGNMFAMFVQPSELFVLWMNLNDTGWAFAGNVDLSFNGISPLNEWHQYAFSHDTLTNKTKMYVDGIKLNDLTNFRNGNFNYSDASDTFFIGSENSEYFNGTLDEIAVFNTTLTEQEVKILYLGKIQTKSITGLENSSTFDIIGIQEGNFEWNCQAENIFGLTNISDSSRFFDIDTTFPDISFVPQTDPDKAFIDRNSSYVNVSVNDSLTPNNLTAFIDWNRSLVGWWRFSEGSGQEVNDSSSWGNDGSCPSGPISCPGWTLEGKFGGALESFISSSGMDLGNDPSLDITGEITLEVWVKPKEMFLNMGIVGRGDTSSDKYLLSFVSGNRTMFTYGDGLRVFSSSAIQVDKFYHIAGVFNGTHKLIYVDGVLENTAESSVVPTTDLSKNSYIGGIFNQDRFVGIIDEVKVWSRALSPEEINASYNAGVYRLERNFTNLIENSEYQYTAYVQDLAGNLNQTETRTLTVDLTNPLISFVPPTLGNNSVINRNWTEVNISSTEFNLDEFTFNWNNTNYTFYDDSLVLMMNFDNVSSLGENDTYVKDVSQYGNDGTCSGGVSCPNWDSSGKYGGAYDFDNFNSILNVPYNNSLDGMSELTVGFWYKVSLCNGEDTFVKKDFSYTVRMTGLCEIRVFTWADQESRFLTSTGTFTTNVWNYFVLVYNGTDQSIYMNGVFDSSNSQTGPIDINATHNLTIGSSATTLATIAGLMDEVRIWNRSLSDDEIKQLYQSNLYKYDIDKWAFYANQSDLIAGSYDYYGYVKDLSGKSNITETRIVRINAPPLVSSVILNSTSLSNSTADNLTVYYTTADPDGDPITNITDWRVEGNSIAVLNMPFDTNISSNGTDLIRDYSTFGNNGTLGGGDVSRVPLWISDGKIGGAYDFDGIDDYIVINNSSSLDLTRNMTVSAWIKREGGSGDSQTILFKGNWTNVPAARPQFVLLIDNLGKINFMRGVGVGGDTEAAISNTVIVDNTFYYLVGVDNGTSISVYVDGVLEEVVDKTITVGGSSENFYIGVFNFIEFGLVSYFDGTIDEVKIYNRTLSPQQIMANYQAGLANHSVETMVSQETRLGDNWTVAVTPNDGFSDGNTLLSNNLEIDVTAVTCGDIIQTSGRYGVIESVTNYGGSPCIEINVSDVILDCNGYTLDGRDAAYSRGINASGTSGTRITNVTVQNCVLTNWGYGIGYNYIDNSSIVDSIMNSNLQRGIFLENARDNLFSNITSIFNGQGFAYDTVNIEKNTIQNSNLINNTDWDLFVRRSGTTACDLNLSNVIGTDNKPIVFYNDTVNLQNWDNNFSELILCNADNSILNNITLNHVDVKNNGIMLVGTSGGRFSNIGISNSYSGFFEISSSPSNIFTNITTTFNSYGIFLSISNNQTLRNIIADSNTNLGIYVNSDNVLDNVTVTNTFAQGIYLFGFNNLLMNSTITDNSGRGVLLLGKNNTLRGNVISGNGIGIEFGSSFNTPNLIYNNMMNNSNNYRFTSATYENYLNTTLNCTGAKNIIGGNCTGGNYWANPSSSGFSDTCDASSINDGICKDNYPTIYANNIDYFPLTFNVNTLPVVTLISPADNNVTTNRNPSFNWSGFDADGDSLVYQFNISLKGVGVCSDPRLLIPRSIENYTIVSYLECLSDNNNYYNWTVRASDDNEVTWGDWATPRRINISSFISINLTTSTINFGSLLLGDSNSTIDNFPPPFSIENDGNAFVNVTINASDLWSNPIYQNPTLFFTYKIDNRSEPGSFNYFQSQTVFTPVPTALSPQLAIVHFNWSDATDLLEVDLNVTVPGVTEGAGDRSSVITFIASLDE